MEGWRGCPFPSSATASTSAKTQIRATTARGLEEEVGVVVEVGAVEEEGEEVVELVAVEQPVLVVQEHLEEELAVEQGQAVWWPPQPPQGQ